MASAGRSPSPPLPLSTTRPPATRELIPAATLHPHNYLRSERSVAALAEQGFRIFRFLNRLEGYSLNLYCVRALMRDLAKAGLPCIVDAAAMDDPYRVARLTADTGVTAIVTGLGYTFEAEAIALANRQAHQPGWNLAFLPRGRGAAARLRVGLPL